MLNTYDAWKLDNGESLEGEADQQRWSDAVSRLRHEFDADLDCDTVQFLDGVPMSVWDIKVLTGGWMFREELADRLEQLARRLRMPPNETR